MGGGFYRKLFVIGWLVCTALFLPPLWDRPSTTELSQPLQTVQISKRTFWLGEIPATMEFDASFIPVRRINWIEAVIAQDPILEQAVFHIEKVHIPIVENRITRPGEYDRILLGPDRLPAEFDLPNYEIYGPATPTASSFDYIPKDKQAEYFVGCSQNTSLQKTTMTLCVVRASYAPDRNIGLKARLYFPPNPIDAPTLFSDVVRRMRKVAACLDVTEKIVDVAAEKAMLSGCTAH